MKCVTRKILVKYWCAYHFPVQNNIYKNTKSNVIGVNSNYYMSDLFFRIFCQNQQNFSSAYKIYLKK